jgi:hypothetical protein
MWMAGCDFRLTDVQGRVVKEIVARLNVCRLPIGLFFKIEKAVGRISRPLF